MVMFLVISHQKGFFFCSSKETQHRIDRPSRQMRRIMESVVLNETIMNKF